MKILLFLLPMALACAAEGTSKVRRAIADPFDNICLPQIAAGGGWKTTITIVNMDSKSSNFELIFADPTGRDLPLRLNTPSGIVTTDNVTGTLPANGSAVYETTDSPTLTQAFGLLLHAGVAGCKAWWAGMPSFNSRLPGGLPLKPSFRSAPSSKSG